MSYQQKQNISQINESGRTMLEMLGVVMLIVVIGVGGITGFTTAMNIYRTNQVYDQVEEIVQGVKDTWSWARSYADVSKRGLCNNDIAVDACVDGQDSDTMMNIFGGKIDIASADLGVNFHVSYENVPKAVCVALYDKNWVNANIVSPKKSNCQSVSPTETTVTMKFTMKGVDTVSEDVSCQSDMECHFGSCEICDNGLCVSACDAGQTCDAGTCRN